MLIKIKLLEGGRMPEKATPGAAAFDCYVRETMVINGEPAKVPLGFALELPEGWRAAANAIFAALVQQQNYF